VLNGRPVKVVEVTHAQPGKHGHSKVLLTIYFSLFLSSMFIQVHLIGIDIFTGRRYEDVRPSGHVIQVPNIRKKDYLVVNIDDDNYITLLNEDTCNVRSDMKLKEDSDITRRMLDKFNEGNGQIKVTVLSALGEEQIMSFKTID
jgi:translation initiation factor 5A